MQENSIARIREVEITTEYITLGQLLKYTGTITNGSDVKIFLSENEVFINDILDLRRGRKLYPNDLVSVPSLNLKFIVIINK
ncbi:MAG: RNA-binding S4 domain-containing protein [Mycoplasma sp.]